MLNTQRGRILKNNSDNVLIQPTVDPATAERYWKLNLITAYRLGSVNLSDEAWAALAPGDQISFYAAPDDAHGIPQACRLTLITPAPTPETLI